ncbi:MAG: serine hydrolase, partial [Bacteroidota bacterium]
MRYFFLISIIFLAIPSSLQAQLDDPLKQVLQEHQDKFDDLLKEDKYEIQIIYTQINRDEANRPSFRTYRYGVDEERYFYPASTVKMPTAFVAMEKLNELSIRGLDYENKMITGVGTAPQTGIEVDSTAMGLAPSVGQYVKKIFLVSDNDAQNRLYEFVGQAELNQRLREKGFKSSRIIHRLGAGGPSYSVEQNQYTNPISFYKGDQLLYHQGEVHSQIPFELDLSGEIKGKAYQSNGTIIEEPFDFSQKNFISLQNLHDILQRVIFPESAPPEQRFSLSEKDYQFLYRCMSMKPRESKSPLYDKPDGYVKFFIYEGEAEKIPDPIRIFNKVGWAYGYLTDVAYIIDLEKKVEFMLAAVIHVNDNQTYNDDN